MVPAEEPDLPKEEALRAEAVRSEPTIHPPEIHQTKNGESEERSAR